MRRYSLILSDVSERLSDKVRSNLNEHDKERDKRAKARSGAMVSDKTGRKRLENVAKYSIILIL